MLAEELKHRQWTELEIKARRKRDPEKLSMAIRMRKETILPMRTKAHQVWLREANHGGQFARWRAPGISPILIRS
jgi:hypothetical protein